MLRLCKSSIFKTSRLLACSTPLAAARPSVLASFNRAFSGSVVTLEYNNDRRGNGQFRFNNDRNSNDRYGNNNKFNNDGYNRNRSWGGNRRNNDRRGNRKGTGQGEFDQRRNTSSNNGPEGDGLKGLPEYERVKDLENVDLSVLCSKDGASSKGDFSSVETESLAEHKILSRVLVNSLTDNRGYKSLTAVQAQTLVPILRGDSVVVRAKTGTGKTAAFSIPSIQHVIEAVKNDETGVKALIISPTRELAQQIADEISAITAWGEMRKLLTVCMVGGLSKQGQIKHAFEGRKKADIIVATPGRLFDVLQVPGIGEEFANLKIKVLDEADRLLDIGFADSLRDIDNELKRYSDNGFQTLLFSATIDRAVRQFASAELGSKAKVIDTVPKNEPEAHELVNQKVVVTNSWEEMYPAAYKAISEAQKMAVEENNEIFKGIVFMPTVPSCDHFTDIMKHAMADAPVGQKQTSRLQVMTLHGQMTQAARQRVADKFRKSDNALLITTDVVARGMDFPGVSHVFQLGAPRDVASYVHRIGRTGRIGNKGDAALLITQHEKGYLRDLKSRNISIEDVTTYKKSDEAEHEEVIKSAVDFLAHDDEFKETVISGILSSFAHLRKEYNVNGREYLRDNARVAETFGLEDYRPGQSLVRTWGAHRDAPRQRYWDSNNSSASGFARRGGQQQNYDRRGNNNQNRRRY
ncbi:hypothetical protein D0Z03_002018 [Geotrichum reessii]|nr:hypothetical protein D0Z03_002018 [Galactomyces reessii]